MGASQSQIKANQDQLVFTNPNAYSVQISESALRALQGLSEELPPSQNVDSIVSKRVEQELDRAKQRRLHTEKSSADQVRRETEELLARQKIITVPTPDPRILELENKLVACLKGNSSRPLDCWREVSEFKMAARVALHQ